jgi:hypothetical protein
MRPASAGEGGGAARLLPAGELGQPELERLADRRHRVTAQREPERRLVRVARGRATSAASDSEAASSANFAAQ